VTSGAPIIGSGSYNNSPGNSAGNPIPAGQAVGVYRLLRGSGSTTGNVTFAGVPAAVAPSTYNQSEATNQVRVAYGFAVVANQQEAWGTWCATCHTQMHSANGYVHPVDQILSGTVINNYNLYVNSSNTAGGSQTTAFLSLVPFVEGTSDYTVLGSHAVNDNSYLNGPGGADRVTCMSCHRAHATGWENMLRWNMEGEFMTLADSSGNPVYPGIDTTPNSPQFARGRTSAETQAAYYDRPVTVFGAYQRVLCNKCHAQD
jgi:cytochrome c553